jgi:hypothetical protein
VEHGHKMAAQKLILHELTTEFGGAAAAVATPFERLKNTFHNIEVQVGQALLPVFNRVAGLLAKVLPAAIGGLTGLFGKLAPLWRSFVQGFSSPGGDVVGGGLLANLIRFGQAVRRFVDENGPKARAFFGHLKQDVVDFATRNGPAFIRVLEAAGKIVLALALDIAALIRWLSQHKTAVQAVVVGILAMVAAFKAWQAVMSIVKAVKAVRGAIIAMNAALAANPVGVIILLIIGLAAALIYAYKHSKTFRDIVEKVWKALQTAIRWVAGLGTAIKNVFAKAIDWLYRAGRNVISGFWNGMKAIWEGAKGVLGWWGGLELKVLGYFAKAGAWLLEGGKNILRGLWNGIKAIWDDGKGGGVVGWFKGFPSKILSALGIHSPPAWAIDAGRHIMGGLLKGIAHGAGDIAGFFKGLASNVLGPLKGIWSAVSGAMPAGGAYKSVVELAQAMVGMRWGSGQWPAFNMLEMQEAGYNVFATNPTSGAFGIPQALPKSKLPPAALSGPVMGMATAQLQWMLDYIAGRYINPAGAWAHEQAFNWYGKGLEAVFSSPTLIGVGERGAERVSVTPLRSGGGGRALPAVTQNFYVQGNLDRDAAAQLERGMDAKFAELYRALVAA